MHKKRALAPRTMALAVALLAGLWVAASAHAGTDEEELARVRKDILDLIGDPFCTNLVYCRVLALGVKPCGKPDEYLAYSNISGTNTTTLETKAAEYAFLQEEVQASNPPKGACVVPKQPDVKCVDQRCKLAQ